ncbi:MAG: TetR/AcrR family transcriptional regulator [Bacteroidota bacterium]
MYKSRRQQILGCAAVLFRKKGFKGTSLAEIAKELGMEAPSLYNHIKSKNEILEALLMDIAHRFTRGMEEINGASLAADQKLEKLVGLHVRLTVDHTDAISLVTGEWVHLKKPALDDYIQLRNAYETQFKDILVQCMKLDYFNPLSPDIALFSILSSLHWLYSWYDRNRDISPLDLEKEMVQCLIAGLRS